MRGGIVGLIVAAVIAVLAYSSLFIITPAQQAIVLQFGEVRRAVTSPGLNFKIPFIQNVVFLDKRVLDLQVPELEAIAADQKRLVVDAFARYRIINPVLFYQTVNNVDEGNRRLSTFVQSSIRSVLAEESFLAVVRDSRPDLMRRIREDVQRRANGIGVEVVDVRLRRADLPEANSQAIFSRMQTERQREATEIRAQGAEAAARIRAQADRQATVIIAEANRTADETRGEGDARRAAIFAGAFGKDPDFFAFFRSMQAYEAALKPDGTRMVLSPKSEFFRYFNDPKGRSVPAPAAPAAAQ
ncbi:protease modulator HflC [Pseudoxanthobacter sp.]|uniref:protease modulator HflC n=1 Tax=Pseudoxanthobacter sp. TaxID=1925742 RepID=UPI002FE1EAF5